MLIYHIIPQNDWRDAVEQGSYQPESLASEGFIHFSKKEQVIDTAHRYYHGRTDMQLLQVDTDKAVAQVKFENTHGGEELFPHLYGLLNLDSVTNVYELTPDQNGIFSLPARIEKE
ncbi:MAG: DUF952 domain-containing protein [Anaerolineaceae bacterium]|nr:DUF952 domain-containing protein [Anaerolineaceae bacterium]